MTQTPNAKTLELLSSKICHDLISPIGAINNGLEILEDMGPDAGEDVIGLISYSAQQASAKLQAYRLAYGAGSKETDVKPEDVHKALQDFIEGEQKFTQDWDPHGAMLDQERPEAYGKMLTAAALLGLESLPKGGAVKIEPGSSEGHTLITGIGEDAGPRPQAEPALNGDISPADMEPRLVHPYITGLLARHYGYSLSFTEDGPDGQVTLSLTAP